MAHEIDRDESLPDTVPLSTSSSSDDMSVDGPRSKPLCRQNVLLPSDWAKLRGKLGVRDEKDDIQRRNERDGLRKSR